MSLVIKGSLKILNTNWIMKVFVSWGKLYFKVRFERKSSSQFLQQCFQSSSKESVQELALAGTGANAGSLVNCKIYRGFFYILLT